MSFVVNLVSIADKGNEAKKHTMYSGLREETKMWEVRCLIYCFPGT